MRQSARNILDHYDFEIIDSEAPFEQLLHGSSYDGAIVTTRLFNDNLHEVLSTGEFTILDIPNAPAIAQKHAYFYFFEIPAGLYAESPSIPHHPTVSITSLLAVHKNAPENMIAATLETLYSTDFTQDIPNLKSYEEASAWNIFPMHPASQHYFQPYEGIEDLANLLSSLEAIKELLIATEASIFLIWQIHKYYLELIKEQAIETQKEKLESLLQETLKVERKHITESDLDELEKVLNQVTNTKLRAFEILMGYGIIDQQSFTLFLIQCNNLSSPPLKARC